MNLLMVGPFAIMHTVEAKQLRTALHPISAARGTFPH
jgi:hypothetical protein